MFHPTKHTTTGPSTATASVRALNASANVVTLWLMLLLLASAVPAEWLVLRDGTRLETRGAWAERGRQVVFTSPAGKLQALRLDDVDLQASNAESQAAKLPAPPAPPEPTRQAALVLTMDDIPAYRPPTASPVAEDDGGKVDPAAAAPAPCADGGGLRVTSWKPKPSDDVGGVEIFGTLHNPCDRIMTHLGVHVALQDDAGTPVADADAFLRAPVIAPGATTSFRALFPGVQRVDGEPTFDVRGRGLRFEPVTESTPEDEGDGAS